METLRVILADDHLDVLTSLSARLKREPSLEIVGQATNSAQAVALSISQDPDIVIIDPVMRDGKGLAAVQQITKRRPNAFIVVLTAIADTAMKVDLDKLGVNLIISKGTETTTLIDTLTTSYTQAS